MTTSRLALAALLATALAGRAARAADLPAPPAPAVADLPAVLTAVRAPGARAVLVNVWATWCDPCRAELPELLRFYRDHRAGGLRLVLVSADDEQDRDKVARVLADAGLPADTATFIKHGDDMKFIDGLDHRWSGALPASFLYDGHGRKRRWWSGPITYHALDLALAALLPGKHPTERRRP